MKAEVGSSDCSEWSESDGEDNDEIIRNNKEDLTWKQPHNVSRERRMTKKRRMGSKKRKRKSGHARNLKHHMKNKRKRKNRGALSEKTKKT